jgi:CcmD family protein
MTARCAMMVGAALLLAAVPPQAGAAPAGPGGLVVVLEQTGGQPPVPEGFEPIANLPPAETLPAAPLLIGAYAFVWVMILLYVWGLWRRLGAVEKEIAAVSRQVADTRRA